MIFVHSRHTPASKLAEKYPCATVVDVTSRGPEPWVELSPFYPHGNLPVPGMPGRTGASVEGIWQGLKVFETEDVDETRFEITSMKGLKRTVRKYGRCLGHRFGDGLIGYRDARHRIFLPLYRRLLEGPAAHAVTALRAIEGDILLLDYMTNCDVDELSKPLSHAGLVRAWMEDAWPNREER